MHVPQFLLQVTGPSVQALRQLSPKLLNKPDTIWSRRTFGIVEPMPASWVIVAFSTPVGDRSISILIRGCLLQGDMASIPTYVPSQPPIVVRLHFSASLCHAGHADILHKVCSKRRFAIHRGKEATDHCPSAGMPQPGPQLPNKRHPSDPAATVQLWTASCCCWTPPSGQRGHF